MKRILFITYWPFENEASNGICKKIRAQAEALSSFGMQVDLTYMKNGNMMLNSEQSFRNRKTALFNCLKKIYCTVFHYL